ADAVGIAAGSRIRAAAHAPAVAAVVGGTCLERFEPLLPEKGLADASVDVIPGKDLFCRTRPVAVPVEIQSSLVERLKPGVVAEALAPAVEPRTELPGPLDDVADAAVSARQQRLDLASVELVPVDAQPLRARFAP